MNFMKEKYIGYYKKSPDEIKKIWDEGFITFDANVLLNLYRYSSNTKKEIIKLIEKFSGKVFLTHQAGLEFHRNRFEVISEQEKVYKEFTENLTKIEEELNSKSKHPFLSAKLQQKLNTVFKEVKDETKNSEEYYCNLIITDEIYDEINNLFSNKIEKEYTEEEKLKLFEEGKKRFEKKIPPGFEDEKDKEGARIYGDFILWKQIIDKAKDTNKPVILVTDERKKDWWWKLKNGKIIGPRQELVEEMYKESGVEFHLYSTEKFVEYGLSYLKESSKPKVIEEVKNFREEKSRVNELIFQIQRDYDRKLRPDFNEKENLILQQESSLKERLRFIESQIIRFNEKLIMSSASDFEDNNRSIKEAELKFILSKLEHDRIEILKRLESLA